MVCTIPTLNATVDHEELSDDDIEKAYQDMCSKWIKLCKQNKKLEDRVVELVEERGILKRAMINYEFQATKKKKVIQKTHTQLEETQKFLRMLNFGSTKLDHILSIGKSCGDHHGLGYTGEVSSSKTVFVKVSTPLDYNSYPSKKSKPTPPKHKRRRFIPTCHYHGFKGHIRPRCFKYQNALERGMVVYSSNFAKPKRTPKLNFDLKINSAKKIWIRKYDLRCLATYISF